MKLSSSKSSKLKGEITVPGDKSISHRSLILGSQAIGTTTVTGLLEGEDVLSTAQALREMGVGIEKKGDVWSVKGVGVGGLVEPKNVLDMGNSGTSSRLLMGLVTPYQFNSFFCGDASLSKRPMKRVTDPLREMGAEFVTTSRGTFPLCTIGTKKPLPIEYKLPVASAQVKSAIILAGLNTKGTTTVIEPKPTRDHTEIMLRGFGAEVISDGMRISVKGYPKLKAQKIVVPADPSSAAFLVVAALITEGSELLIKNVGMNPHRIGLFETLVEMGGKIEKRNERKECGEKVADLFVQHSKLKGIRVPKERAPSMIDEYPVLAVAASCAEGVTQMCGLEELRVKESDRLQVVYDALVANGVKAKISGDDLHVTGSQKPRGGGVVKTHLDHRIAMSFLILGLVSEKDVAIDDGTPINTSFPNFVELLKGIGAKINA